MICPLWETGKPENPENPGNRLRRGPNRRGVTGPEPAPILGFPRFPGFPTYLGLLVYRGATLKWETDLALGVTP